MLPITFKGKEGHGARHCVFNILNTPMRSSFLFMDGTWAFA